jgi:signal transduction histidine kinase
VRRFLRDPGYRVRYRRFDENDGLAGTVSMMYPVPSMVPLPGGRLAVSTTGGLFLFDPSQAQRNRLPPPVHVTGIVADGTEYAAAHANVRLAPAPDNLRIDYTALSLALPRRVRFQYMLEGVDRDWQDAGNRRSAFYTGLAPGSYGFRVKAANDDGVWNEDGARLAFTIPPTMVQTTWFRLACALFLVLAVYGMHRLRLALALRSQRSSFETRVAEREGIARDLHDTLLQSVQGLIMHFRRIALRTPQDAPTRPLMEEALALATEVLEEGRDKVGDLRHASRDADLAALLASHGQRLAAQHAVAFALREEGSPRPLRPDVLDEILAIGREAVGNAFLHAQASRIEALLQHGDHEIVLTVSDDGCGIDPSLRQGRAGHWGIPGMRERAAALGAALELDANPGKGSTWRLRLPTRVRHAGRGTDATLSG